MPKDTPTHGQLLALLERAVHDAAPDEVIERLRWFAHFTKHHSVARTCKEFGIARTTFYRWYKRFDISDISTLQNVPKSSLLSAEEEVSASACSSCPLCILRKKFTRWAQSPAFYIALAIVTLLNISLLLFAIPQTARAETWDVRMLVNTEAFQMIDDMDEDADLQLKFGSSINKSLTYEREEGLFKFDDDLSVEGKVTGEAVHVDKQFSGAGLKDCDGKNDKLIWDSETQQFGCAKDNKGGTRIQYIRVPQSRRNNVNPPVILNHSRQPFQKALGDTVINSFDPQSAYASLELQRPLLIFENDDVSEAVESVVSSILREALVNCNGTRDKLLWDGTENKFICGRDRHSKLQQFTGGRAVEEKEDTTSQPNRQIEPEQKEEKTNTTFRPQRSENTQASIQRRTLPVARQVLPNRIVTTGREVTAQQRRKSAFLQTKNLNRILDTLQVEGNMVSSGTIVAEKGIFGAGLSDCDEEHGKLLWDGESGLFKCGIDSSGTIENDYMPYAAIDSEGKQVIARKPTTVRLGKEQIAHTNYSLSDHQIVIHSPGTYQISYTFNYVVDSRHGNTHGHVSTYIEQNSGSAYSSIPGSNFNSYHYTYDGSFTNATTFLTTTSEHDTKIRLQMLRSKGSTAVETMPGQVTVTIIKLQ